MAVLCNNIAKRIFIQKMKKVTIFVLIVAVLLLASCNVEPPLGDKDLPSSGTDSQLNIYVCGAVQNEGYVTVNLGEDYFSAVSKAGIIEQSKMPSFGDQLVDKNQTVVIVEYVLQGVSYTPINVNGPLVTRRTTIPNVDSVVVDMLADFIENNGNIKNRAMLQKALGDYYQDNFYKFFVGVDDYEKAN